MTMRLKAGGKRSVAAAALALVGCLQAWGQGQHGSPPPRPAPHAQPARPEPAPRQQPRQNQYRPPQQPQQRPQNVPRNYPAPRPAPNYPTVGPRPGYPNPNYPGVFPGGNPGRITPTNPGAAPPGHLGAWLNEHRSLPPQEQERTLRADPSFNRLPSGDQQRLLQQLHQVNQMPEQQRDRRLARNEMLERLSPQDRMQANLAMRSWAGLPPDRQGMMKRAFQDLRAVPVDQRQTVLSSSRYQSAFSPQERGILSDLLRVEPYQPAR